MAVTREQMEQELQDILANAEERAQLIEAGKQRADFLDDPVNEFGYNFTVGVSNTLGVPVDAVNAVVNASGLTPDAPFGSGENIQDLFDLVMDVPEGLSREAEGPLAGAGQVIGATAVITPALLAPYLKEAALPQAEFDRLSAQRIGQFQGTGPGTPGEIPRTKAARALFILKSLQRDAARMAAQNPKTFIAGEVAAAGAAGAAGEMAEESGASPGQRLGVETVAGVVAGTTPAAIPAMARNMYRWGMKNIFPMTREGGELRAAAQMQERAEDPAAAAEQIEAMLIPQRDPETGEMISAPMEGVDPARVTGERRLMAQTRRVLEDDPATDKAVRDDLQAASQRAMFELRNLYNTPRGRAAWEEAIFTRLAPPGTTIRQASAEEMLDQMYKGFKPLYAEFKGYPIRPQLYGSRDTALKTMIGNVPESNRVHASEATREAVARRLNSMYQGFSRKVKNGLANSEAYFEFRSKIRDEQRRRMKAGDDESAALYRLAEEKINAVLSSQLPEGVMPAVRGVDQHYRNYHILADAIYRRAGTDSGLTPEGLLMALKTTASNKGGYARGDMMDLRASAVSGKPIAPIINDPYAITRRVRNMSAEDIAETQSDMFHTLLQQAKTFDADTGTEGVSGERFLQLLNDRADSLVAAQMDEGTINRAREIAEQLAIMEAKSPSAVAELYEDGPANILELMATLVGAKQGQRVAGRGMGSSLVLAQYFAQKARKTLETLTQTEAADLLSQAATDPELFAALLTKQGALPRAQYEATQLINGYLVDIARRAAEEGADQFKETRTQERAYEDTLRKLRRELKESNANPLY